MRQKLTTTDFVARAKKIHGDTYLYDKACYIGLHKNINITCRVHGDFLQLSSVHLHRGGGCPECCYENRRGNKSPCWTGGTIVSGHYFSSIKRHAKTKKRKFSITLEYIDSLLLEQNMRCAISGLLLTFGVGRQKNVTTASLDRIDSKKGYIEENVQWVHKDLQSMKGDKTDKIFIELCKIIADYNRNG